MHLKNFFIPGRAAKRIQKPWNKRGRGGPLPAKRAENFRVWKLLLELLLVIHYEADGGFFVYNNYSLLLESCPRPLAGKGPRLSRFFSKVGIVAFKSSPERNKNLLTAFYLFPNKILSFLSFYFTKLELNFFDFR